MEREIAGASNAFALDLYKKLAAGGGNLFFSPFSVFVAVAMALPGARGETADCIAGPLRFPRDPGAHRELGSLLARLAAQREGGHTLRIANSLWLRRDLRFLDEFVGLLREHYRAQPHQADFTAVEEACAAINGWVSDRTEGRIRDLVRPQVHVNAETLAVLVNAIYFKARWEHVFDDLETKPLDFAAPAGTVRAPMMQMESEYSKFRFLDEGRFKLLELPYGGPLSMVLALPAEDGSLESLDRMLDAALLERSLAAMKSANVRMRIPRFKLETACSLRETLCALGMAPMFETTADFSGMTRDAPVMIGDAIHKAFVTVDETGTEAAAATAVVAMVGAMFDFEPPRWVTFYAERPFLFMIVGYRTVLFMGRVVNPAAANTTSG